MSRAMKSVEYEANVGESAVPESPEAWSAHSIDVCRLPSPSSRMKLLFPGMCTFSLHEFTRKKQRQNQLRYSFVTLPSPKVIELRIREFHYRSMNKICCNLGFKIESIYF